MYTDWGEVGVIILVVVLIVAVLVLNDEARR